MAAAVVERATKTTTKQKRKYTHREEEVERGGEGAAESRKQRVESKGNSVPHRVYATRSELRNGNAIEAESYCE